jgi:hypothetical protein
LPFRREKKKRMLDRQRCADSMEELNQWFICEHADVVEVDDDVPNLIGQFRWSFWISSSIPRGESSFPTQSMATSR